MAIELRPLTVDDADVLLALIRAAETADGVPFVTTRAEVEHRLTVPHARPERNGRLALLDGEVAGYALVDHLPSGDRLERALLDGVVHPRHRRRGVGRALLEWELARASTLLAAHTHDLPRFARVQQRADRDDAAALYRRFALRPVRYSDVLLRPLDLPIDAAVAPAGIEVAPWDAARSEEIRLVNNAAFADHWGTTPTSAAAWADWVAEATKRLDLSWIALSGGEVVGYSLNDHYAEDVEVSGRLDGWISHLGVLREHRARGVASALVGASLRSFKEAGFTHAALSVDTENPSGAYGLYQRLGFEPHERWVTHEIEVHRRQS